MIKAPKFSDTSIRVLETLKLLVKSDSSIQDIINYFEVKDSHNKTYTNEAILKYINTLKVFGFKIIKDKDKYVLLNVPHIIDFTEKELRTMKMFEEFSNILLEKNINKEINTFLQNLEKRFSNDTSALASSLSLSETYFDTNYKKYEKKIRKYEKFCADRQKLKVTYWHAPNVKNSVIVEPKDISYVNKSVFLRVYNPVVAEFQDLNIDDVISIEQLPVKANPSNILSSVTFRLSGRLAKGYKMHSGERLVNIEDNGNILIMNQTEDKNQLLRRLMRYGSYCEVISPKKIREDMKMLIKNTLANYRQ